MAAPRGAPRPGEGPGAGRGARLPCRHDGLCRSPSKGEGALAIRPSSMLSRASQEALIPIADETCLPGTQACDAVLKLRASEVTEKVRLKDMVASGRKVAMQLHVNLRRWHHRGAGLANLVS
eukprot:SM000009S23657  [mRNA]  locus=s9:1308533:1311712:- [translate_table: standard]